MNDILALLGRLALLVVTGYVVRSLLRLLPTSAGFSLFLAALALMVAAVVIHYTTRRPGVA